MTAPHQLSLLDTIAEHERAETLATRHAHNAAAGKTWDQLVPGDLIRVFAKDETAGGVLAWVAGREIDRDPHWIVLQLHAAPDWSTYRAHRDVSATWTRLWPTRDYEWVRFDPAWRLSPSEEEVVATVPERVARASLGQLPDVYHTANHLIPFPTRGADGRTRLDGVWTEALTIHVPIADFVAHTGARGNTAWPKGFDRGLETTISPLPGSERLNAYLALTWPSPFGGAQHYHATGRTCSIYDGYLRWAVAAATHPRDVVRLLAHFQTVALPRENEHAVPHAD